MSPTTAPARPGWILIAAVAVAALVIGAFIGGALGASAVDSTNAAELASVEADLATAEEQNAATRSELDDTESQLTEISSQLTALEDELGDTTTQLSAATADGDHWLSLYHDTYDKGQFVLSQYNSLGARHVDVVARFNALVADYNAKVDAYNTVVLAYDAENQKVVDLVGILTIRDQDVAARDLAIADCQTLISYNIVAIAAFRASVEAAAAADPVWADIYASFAEDTLAEIPVSCGAP